MSHPSNRGEQRTSRRLHVVEAS